MIKKKGILIFALFLWSGMIYAEDALRQTIIETAKQYQGVAYRYGAESPKAFDCSGFVRFVYRTAAGIDLPRTSRNIWASGQSIAISEAQPGDVVVFAARKGGAVDHVAILLDNDSIIHAVSQGPKTGVIISPLADRYFGPRILGVKTFIIPVEAVQPETPPALPADEGSPEAPAALSGTPEISAGLPIDEPELVPAEV